MTNQYNELKEEISRVNKKYIDNLKELEETTAKKLEVEASHHNDQVTLQ